MKLSIAVAFTTAGKIALAFLHSEDPACNKFGCQALGCKEQISLH